MVQAMYWCDLFQEKDSDNFPEEIFNFNSMYTWENAYSVMPQEVPWTPVNLFLALLWT